MSTELKYKPLDNVGLNGLNLQANPASLDPSWLTQADNVVLRESGRISFRKGLKQNILKTTAKVGSIGENGAGVVVAAVGTNMYTVDFSTPDTPWTGAFATGGSDSNWQIIDFNRELYCVQDGHTPIELDGTTWTALPSTAGYAAPAGVTTFDPSCGMGFYGRLWVGGITEEKDVVYYSDTLNAHIWSTGAAGYIDLKTVWGTDDIVAIAAFYGKLVIFGKSNIVIYQDPIDPSASSFQLDEVIRGIGCVSRDSVQAVGDDLYFLSSTGVRSLNRTTEKDNVPLEDLSLTIKDTIIRNIAKSTEAKGVYVEDEGTYVLSFTELNITYVFDIKHETPSGTPRITTWSFDGDIGPASFAYTDSKGFLIGQQSGSIATYEGYYDKAYVSGGTYTNTSYTGIFRSTWVDLGQGAVASLLKKLKAVINGGGGTTIGIKWYKDFSNTPSKITNFVLNPATTTALYGASGSLFGASKYAPIFGMKEYNVPLAGSAKYLQIEFTGETSGSTASLQDMTLLYKQGKIR